MNKNFFVFIAHQIQQLIPNIHEFSDQSIEQVLQVHTTFYSEMPLGFQIRVG
jgi:hypothetical protein